MEELIRDTMIRRFASGKEPTCQSRRQKRCGFNFKVTKIPWRRKWHPLQYPCLDNPMYRGALEATVHEAAKSLDMTETT